MKRTATRFEHAYRECLDTAEECNGNPSLREFVGLRLGISALLPAAARSWAKRGEYWSKKAPDELHAFEGTMVGGRFRIPGCGQQTVSVA